MRAGNPEAALSSVAKSAFRRVPRLVLPTSIATLGIWIFCQLGLFTISHRTTSWWVGATSPKRAESFGQAIWDLVYNEIRTWTHGQNMYDGNQWTLWPLLKGSCIVYVALFATVYVRTRYRMMASLGLFVYYYAASDCKSMLSSQTHPYGIKSQLNTNKIPAAFGMQFFWGMFLADLSNHPSATEYAQKNRWISTIASPLLILIGLIIASYPEGEPQFAVWSTKLHSLLIYILPANSDVPRFSSGIGLEFLSLGIQYSPKVKDILSNKYLLWLGKNSFAVYLIHGTLLRIFLTWMLFGITLPDNVKNDKGELVEGPALEIAGPLVQAVCIPIWFVGLYIVANYWTQYVDPFCAKMTQKSERYVFVEKAEGQSSLPK